MLGFVFCFRGDEAIADLLEALLEVLAALVGVEDAEASVGDGAVEGHEAVELEVSRGYLRGLVDLHDLLQQRLGLDGLGELDDDLAQTVESVGACLARRVQTER